MFDFDDDTVRAGELLDGENEGERFHPAYAFEVQAAYDGLPRLMVLSAEGNEPSPLIAFEFFTEVEKIEGSMRTCRYRPSAVDDHHDQMICRVQIVGNPGEWAYFLGRYAASLGYSFGLGEYEDALRNLEREAISLFGRLPDLNLRAKAHRERWAGPMLVLPMPHE